MQRSTCCLWLLGLIAGLRCSSPADDAALAPREGAEEDSGLLLGEGEGEPPPGAALDAQRPACLGQTRAAESIGLDIYVMLDISGSMLDVLPQAVNTTKWDAVRRSLEAFVRAPETADIGIGLQYFPLVNEDVPFSCVSNDECGAGGPCTSSVCVRDVTQRFDDEVLEYVGVAREGTCSEDEDCTGPGQRCRNMLGVCVISGQGVPPVGALPLCNFEDDCEGLPGTTCEEIRACERFVNGRLALCTPSLGCPPGGGACLPFPYSCENQTLCDAAEYAAPAVPISREAARTDDIVASLAAQVPAGLTPTGPALGGALEEARSWAAQNPGRQVVTVLATDGLPTECAPVDIPDIARLAADANAGANPVRTFVIGVFGSADLGADGRENLDAIARAGGSERAFVINTAGDVGQEFLNALNEIRDTAVSCVFDLDADAALDYGRVNLRLSDASGAAIDLANVGDASLCGAEQGWYYVNDASGTPLQITVCPATCDEFKVEGVTAELEVGCATRIR